MNIRKQTVIRYISDEGFEFNFEPIENTVIIKKTKNGYESKYLIQDDCCERPDEWENDDLFLIGYHRNFTVDRGNYEQIKKIIFKKEDFNKNNGYNGRVYEDNYGWKSYKEAKKKDLINKEIIRRGKYIPGISKELALAIAFNNSENEQAQEYHKIYYIFGLETYIHSGVVLSLSHKGNFCDRQWDVSQIGLVFVSKKEWRTKEKAKVAAKNLIDNWNKYLSGEVYGIVKEIYNNKKEIISTDSICGYYGLDYALKSLKTDI